MKAIKLFALTLAVVAALALVGCGSGNSGGESSSSGGQLSGSITVQGSDTMVNLAQAWAEEFQKANPGVSISVTGGGSGTGIASLINNTIDFADASRAMKPEEIAQAKSAGVTPVENEVAKDGIVIMVNPANAVKNLTVDQLGKIYRGEITNWKDVGGADKPIVLLGRDTASGTYEFLKDAVVGKDANYAKSMKNLQSSQAIVDEVGKNPDAIGYVGIGYENASVKPVTINDVAASVDTILNKSYPLSRGLFMYSNGKPDGVKKAYLDWILSPAGQKVVESQGFVPLTK